MVFTMKEIKEPVLCISQDALKEQRIPNTGMGILPFDWTKVDLGYVALMTRNICDNYTHKSVGEYFPQIIPYIIVRNQEGKILTYSRGKGTEDRLHAFRSIGFGGHIDYVDTFNHPTDLIRAIQVGADREIAEELDADGDIYGNVVPNNIIIDYTNGVGKVHVGIMFEITLDEVNTDTYEISDAMWLTLDELKQSINKYENWSKLAINYIDNK